MLPLIPCPWHKERPLRRKLHEGLPAIKLKPRAEKPEKEIKIDYPKGSDLCKSTECQKSLKPELYMKRIDK
jgi:hypothetical protein